MHLLINQDLVEGKFWIHETLIFTSVLELVNYYLETPMTTVPIRTAYIKH